MQDGTGVVGFFTCTVLGLITQEATMSATSLNVCYSLGYSFTKVDAQIERVVGRECVGSGCGFGGRDIHFTFRTIRDRDAAVRRLRREFRGRGMTFTAGYGSRSPITR